MRKAFFVLILTVLLLCFAQACADTTVDLEPVSGSVTFGDKYIVLTTANLSEHQELLSSALDIFGVQPDVDLALMKKRQTQSEFQAFCSAYQKNKK